MLICINVMTPFSLRDSNQRTACARSVRVSPHVCCQVYKVQVSVSNIVSDATGSRIHTTRIHKYPPSSLVPCPTLLNTVPTHFTHDETQRDATKPNFHQQQFFTLFTLFYTFLHFFTLFTLFTLFIPFYTFFTLFYTYHTFYTFSTCLHFVHFFCTRPNDRMVMSHMNSDSRITTRITKHKAEGSTNTEISIRDSSAHNCRSSKKLKATADSRLAPNLETRISNSATTHPNPAGLEMTSKYAREFRLFQSSRWHGGQVWCKSS